MEIVLRIDAREVLESIDDSLRRLPGALETTARIIGYTGHRAWKNAIENVGLRIRSGNILKNFHFRVRREENSVFVIFYHRKKYIFMLDKGSPPSPGRYVPKIGKRLINIRKISTSYTSQLRSWVKQSSRSLEIPEPKVSFKLPKGSTPRYEAGHILLPRGMSNEEKRLHVSRLFRHHARQYGVRSYHAPTFRSVSDIGMHPGYKAYHVFYEFANLLLDSLDLDDIRRRLLRAFKRKGVI